MAKVFFSYSHDDEHHRDQLEKHLSALKHQGLIESWHDRRLVAGTHVDQQIDQQLEEADVVLLLVSASFLASHYCYSVELKRALERHEKGQCQVIPIILRACEWTTLPIGKLLAAPRDGKPITLWADYDEAMADVAAQVRKALQARGAVANATTVSPQEQTIAAPRKAAMPRSSNLRLRKDFTDADKDSFVHESFEYFAQFFEGSLQELQVRHPDIEGRYRRIDANCFTATVYLSGKKIAECAIQIGTPFGENSITYSSDARARNSVNEMLRIDHDDASLFWRTGIGGFSGREEAPMKKEQAAERYWALLMRPLQ